ncbi:MAG: hypothetical protein ACXWV6_10100 [Chitinophagaceae bacterium]
MWSHHNYIVCVIEGRKIWHTANGSYDLRKGSCVFVSVSNFCNSIRTLGSCKFIEPSGFCAP